MKRLIALALALIPAVSSAESIPAGCYVADYYRTDPCWYAPSNFYQWVNFPNQADTNLLYGPAMGTIIQAWGNEQSAKNFCIAQRDNAIAAYNSENDRANNNYDVATYYQSEFNKYLKYSKKLKKACGSKCKKIKP